MLSIVYSRLGWDIFAVILFGFLGGLAFGLLDEKGLELPHRRTEGGATFADLGFLANILIGGLAGFLVYVTNQPSTPLNLAFAGITAGIGGTAILRSYVNGKAAERLRVKLSMFEAHVRSGGTLTPEMQRALNQP